ncbi:DUF4293 domain-containing protein [Polluticoccus soli]|uniref:DUF4293 domain-containing protein n=1 Tax=Polluticoccus soli TaxID=3034150 RepID=UPI0023E3294A|nr:DUF4293 domain-containing protein [Flavipsychrobacter sp. JY13-12]
MIQRVQTIWLLLAALANAGLFMLDLYRYDTTVGGAAKTVNFEAMSNPLLMVLAVAITALPFLAIFLFKNRSSQKTLVWLSMVLTIGFVAATLMSIGNITNTGSSAPTNGTYRAGFVLPVLSFIFHILALRGIRKDQKLVKSLDRLR